MIQPFDKHDIVRIGGIDHPESIGIGPKGEAYSTGTGGQIYRIHLDSNTVEQFSQTEKRCLGQAVDAGGNLYIAYAQGGKVIKVTQDGTVTDYAAGPDGRAFKCANYPAFDRQGNLYLSESGDWSGALNGYLHKIKPGGGEAEQWYPDPVDTPNAIALDAGETYLYFVETFGNAIARIEIRGDGSAGAFERVVHMPKHIPDGIALDTEGRIWIACHRPDAIYTFDLNTSRLELFCHDWAGEDLRGPTDVSFAGPHRDIILAGSLDNLVVHRFDGVGAVGIPLNHPKVS